MENGLKIQEGNFDIEDLNPGAESSLKIDFDKIQFNLEKEYFINFYVFTKNCHRIDSCKS